MIGAVKHNPGRPCERSFQARQYPSTEDETEITKPFFRVYLDLLFAAYILSERTMFEKQTGAIPRRDIRPAVLIKADQGARRGRRFPGLGSVDRVLKTVSGLTPCQARF